MKFIQSFQQKIHKIRDFYYKLQRIQEALGRIESKLNNFYQSEDFNDHEFRVFSQWGEDGLIQYLIKNIKVKNKIFIEFGVENYTESNTRFLLVNNYWTGLIIDACQANINYIKEDMLYWAHNLKAVKKFITRENINDLIKSNGIFGDIGLLSIDIDGNDYWVWEAIDCVSPVIVICEYNSLFGPKAKVTIPYSSDFKRDTNRYNIVYYGASLSALDHLAKEKGYSLVGTNNAGNNAFFVRNDVIGNLSRLTPEQAYKPAQFREYFLMDPALYFHGFEDILDHIKDKELYDIEQRQVIRIEDLKAIINPPEM